MDGRELDSEALALVRGGALDCEAERRAAELEIAIHLRFQTPEQMVLDKRDAYWACQDRRR